MAGAALPGEAPLLLRPRPEALGGLADLPGAAAATGAEWPLGSLGSLGGGSPPPAFCGQKPWLALRQANAAGRGAGPALREAGLSAGQARAACRLLAALAPGRGAAGGGGAGGEGEFGACWAIVLLALQTARWPRQRRELAAKASVGLPSAPGEGWPTADPAGEHLHYPYGPGEREDEGLAHQGPLSPRRRHQNPEAGAGGGAEDALAAFLREQLEGLLYMVASATLSLPGATASIRAEEVDALGLLFHAPGPVHGGKQLSEVIPFFAGGREAAPLPAVQQWLLKQLDGPPPEVLTIDRVVRTTAVQRSAVLHRNSVVSNCHDAIVYCMVPASFVLVSGCSDCIILAGAVGQCVRVEYCERVQILAAARCVCVSNCHDSLFNLGVGTRPLLLGDNRNLQLAPYNTYYDQLEAHMELVGLDADVNEWAAPELDCDAGSGERNAAVHLLPPEKFAPFVVPFKRDAGLPHATVGNPYLVPGEYTRTVERSVKAVTDLRREVKQASLEDLTRNDLQTCIQAHFKDWLVSTGKMRQVYDLACLERGEDVSER